MLTQPSIVVNVLPSEDEKEPDEEEPLHWFFRVELPDGDLYALDLTTAQFSSTPGEKPLSIVAPLREHLQRLPLNEDLSNGWQGMTTNLGRRREELVDTKTQLSPQEIMAGEMRHDDMCCMAQKFALVRLLESLSHWKTAQSTTLDKLLRFPVAKFMHMFCTLVWPIELMERELRAGEGLMIVNFIRKLAWDSTTSGPDEYE